MTDKNTLETEGLASKVICMPTLKQAFWYWLKLGFVSFGGPAGQISIMHQDLVETKRWISEKRFLHALNYCMVLPGPEAQQLAIYIGWLMHRTWGGVVAGRLFVLPSLVILTTLSYIYMRFGSQIAIAGILYGVKPAVVAIVLFAAYRIGLRALKNKLLWSIAFASFVAITVLKIPFPIIVLSSALIGVLVHHFQPALIAESDGRKALKQHYGKALIDDDTPLPAHAVFSLKKMIRLIAIGVSIWFISLLVIILYFGVDATLTHMGWFFTKAALLTFGGAYAVLPYVFQGAVGHHQWLTAPQMMDGLALGETTPGPLIMVVTFVGFVGGWTQPFMGADTALLSAIVAACAVTFFTFLPSFLFILAGALFIESTHNNLKLTAPLSAITAAVVGVIMSLALFFATHIFWPNGLTNNILANIDWFACGATLAAVMFLFKFKLGTIKLIGIFAFIGLLHYVLN